MRKLLIFFVLFLSACGAEVDTSEVSGPIVEAFVEPRSVDMGADTVSGDDNLLASKGPNDPSHDNVVDGVDGSSGPDTCGSGEADQGCEMTVEAPQGHTNLTVNFPGVTGVTVEVAIADEESESFGVPIQTSIDQAGQALLVVPVGVYDIRLNQGAHSRVMQGLICFNETCEALASVSTISALFEGHEQVKVTIGAADNQAGSIGGTVVAVPGQTDQTTLSVLTGVYDVEIVLDGSAVVVDNLVCATGGCVVGLEENLGPGQLGLDLEAGLISLDDWALYTIWLVDYPGLLSDRYEFPESMLDNDHDYGTVWMLDAWARWDEVTPEQQELIGAYLEAGEHFARSFLDEDPTIDPREVVYSGGWGPKERGDDSKS